MSSTTDPVRISRSFAAPPEVVFDAWLDPETVRRWLFVGPEGEISIVSIDPRVGGRFSILERAAGGDDIDHFGEYKAIERPAHLAFTLEVPRHFPGVTQVTVDIAASDGGCVLSLTQTGVPAEVTEESWRMMLGTLAAVVGVGR